MSGSGSYAAPRTYTDAEYQAAAAQYIASGNYPSSWGSMIQGLNTSGSVAPPITADVRFQQAVAAAQTAQQAYLSGIRRTGSVAVAAGSAQWTVDATSRGQVFYRDSVSGQIIPVPNWLRAGGVYTNSATGQQTSTPPPLPAPGSASQLPPIESDIPTLNDVSNYLSNLLNSGSSGSSTKLTYAQLAAQAAGSGAAAWLSGIRPYLAGGTTVNPLAPYLLPGSSPSGSYSYGSAPAPPVQQYPSTTGSGSVDSRGISTSWMFQEQGSVNTPITSDEAKRVQKSTDIDSITYSASINDEPKANGPITTLLDLVNRDQQENDLFPLRTEITWFARDTERRLLPFTPTLQEIALRGPGAFGQRFTFDLGSIVVGDLLLGTALQLQLDHWLDAQSRNMYLAEKLSYSVQERPTAWEYANSLGTCIIQQAELEIDGKTIETIDGDFIHVFSSLFPDYNTQVGIAYDHLGQVSVKRLRDTTRRPTIYPIENGNLNCVLPFFFMRTRLTEALPMIAIREGHVKINVTLRPFSECVRQMRGFRDTCTSVPPPTPIEFIPAGSRWTYDPKIQSGSWDVPPQYSFTLVLEGETYNWNFTAETRRGNWVTPFPTTSFSVANAYTWTAATSTWTPSLPPFNIAWPYGTDWYYWDEEPAAWRGGGLFKGAPPFDLTYGSTVWESKVGDWSVAPPPFNAVQLLAYGAIVDGTLRNKMLRDPFEILHREVQTFSFDEPLKYAVGKRADSDVIRIQLPLEANHPIEEILWFVRRKGVSTNNEWTNYSSLTESEWGTRAPTPLLQNAILQVNGTVICDAEEQFYREHAAHAHRGGFAAFSRFIYGYSFAKTPGEHQPSGSLNASRVNSLRLVLDVKPPGGDLWEVKVFCIALNWLRFENGLANPMFED
jgi:hypothetical protein